VIWLKLQLVM